MTTRQTLVILLAEEKLDDLMKGIEELGLSVGNFGNIVRNVKGCAGDEKFCPRSIGNALELGEENESIFNGDCPTKRRSRQKINAGIQSEKELKTTLKQAS